MHSDLQLMGRRNKTHLCGSSGASARVSRLGALSGLSALILLYLCFRRDGCLRHRYDGETVTEEEKIELHRSKAQLKFSEIIRSTDEVRIINIVPMGFSNSKSSGFHELSRRALDQAIGEYEDMPFEFREHSVFFFHSYDSARDDIEEVSSSISPFSVSSSLVKDPRVNRFQIYDQVRASQHNDLITSLLTVRRFIESVVHVRVSLESSGQEMEKSSKKTINKLRSRLKGSKIQLKVFMSDIHADLYRDALTWVTTLAPSLDDVVVISFEVGSRVY